MSQLVPSLVGGVFRFEFLGTQATHVFRFGQRSRCDGRREAFRPSPSRATRRAARPVQRGWRQGIHPWGRRADPPRRWRRKSVAARATRRCASTGRWTVAAFSSKPDSTMRAAVRYAYVQWDRTLTITDRNLLITERKSGTAFVIPFQVFVTRSQPSSVRRRTQPLAVSMEGLLCVMS